MHHWLTRPWVVAVLLALVVIPFFLPLSDGLRFDVVWGPLGDRLHVLLFAVITLLVHAAGPLRGRLLAAAVAAFAAGCAVEVLQVPFGRSPSLGDLGFNALGIAIAVGLVIWTRGRRRLALALLVGIAAVLIVQLRDWPQQIRADRRATARFPVIADFEDDDQVRAWEPFFGAEMGVATVAGDRVLQFTAPANDSWPGVASQRFPLDWSGHDSLLVDVRIAGGPDTLAMGLRLEDADFLDDGAYVSQRFVATGRWRTVALPIHGLLTKNPARPLDLRRVITLKFFASKPAAPAVVQLDEIRLDGAGP